MQSTLEMRWRAGAAWFYWAAAFAIAAAVLESKGQRWAGALGLGVQHSTLTAQAGGNNSIAVLAVAVVLLAIFGWFAGLGTTWAFAAGMVLYAADGALLALGSQWPGLAVHVIVLFFMFGGLTAAGMAKENERLARELEIRAALAKARSERPAMPEDVVKPTSTDPLDAPQPFRPGAGVQPPADEE